MDFKFGPSIDAYGPYGYATALADFVEVAALRGRDVSRSDLEDIISDCDWGARSRSAFVMPDDSNDDAESLATQAFNVIELRGRILGDKYPFIQASNRIRLNEEVIVKDSVYISLLAHSVIHAWTIPSSVSPEKLLERVAVRALEGIGIRATGMGTACGGGFVPRFQAVCDFLGFVGIPDPAPRPVRAKDVGVDTVGGILWPDGRNLGQWLFIGQVTVALSNQWETKLSQLKGSRWAGYFNEVLDAQTFLVVPYHVEEDASRFLGSAKTGLIIDRIRLALMVDRPDGDERKMIETIQAVDIDL